MENSTPRLACIVCRSRKVRCDRIRPSCGNCIRLGVHCPGFDPEQRTISRGQMLKSTEDIFRAAGKEKRRIGACEACRASKSNCTRTKPSCKRCSLRGLDCTYRTRLESASERPAGADLSSDRSPTQSLPGKEKTIVMPGLEIGYDQLCSDVLPESPVLRSHLVRTYFDRIHPLRCLAIIHKPSFLQSLDRASVIQDFGRPLLYIICALSARLLYNDALRLGSAVQHPGSLIPGKGWAEEARKEVLSEIHAPTTKHLMTMVLLCEYGLRTDQNTLVFVLSACLFRSLRLLGLDTPQREDEKTATEILEQETERRIVWASYHIDVLISTGVDRNSMWRDEIPPIPLPCLNQDFLSLTTSARHFLATFESAESMTLLGQLDLPSLVTVLIRLRYSVLRLIRTAPPANVHLWDTSSMFLTTMGKLELIYSHIPERFRLTDLNTYIHKDQNITGAVFFLHALCHAAMFDLTRISIPGFTFPLASGFRNAPAEFQLDCQRRCRFHASEASKIISQAFEHDTTIFDQPFIADLALESAKIQILYSATVDNGVQSVDMTKHNLRTNLRLLKFLHTGRSGQSPHIRALLPLCSTFGLRDFANEWREVEQSPDAPAEVTGPADMHHLSNFALFRKARSEIHDRGSSTATESASSRPSESPGMVYSGNREPNQTLAIASGPGISMEHLGIRQQPSYPGGQQSTSQEPNLTAPQYPTHDQHSSGGR
ncbi:hypothetical protein CONLIGDRAFT_441613 [Coniochaeta ligniaria NRRL 30616]|uniref:Zn(2)-C6 fungal-type domain-containing protein n=1 Tax=Coniochaeta ligniaria NRRL 30616 TaxID=1408157 RepID=A0A1J7JJ34_9PEZI|nr:hypothetical protein CONLIGDRAFT_441613 [Coniochaeta ligniaria NRRL 30616]